jgi:hypothetical protein
MTVHAVPWLLLVKPTADLWTLMAACLFAIPTGVWLVAASRKTGATSDL